MTNRLLDLAKQVLAEPEVNGVMNNAMDLLIEYSGAERGMIILFDEKGATIFDTARNLEKKDIEHPKFEVSQTIIQKVKTSGNPFSFPTV